MIGYPIGVTSEIERISLRSSVLLLVAVGAWCAMAHPLANLQSAIAARLLLMDDVARYKWNHALPIVDSEREAALLERATTEAVTLGLPEGYARRVIAAQIQAARTLQLELVSAWRHQQEPPFDDVPDLNAQQRPAVDAATHQLLEQLHASLCALEPDGARAEMGSVPRSLARHPVAWSTATAALWPLPVDACPH